MQLVRYNEGSALWPPVELSFSADTRTVTFEGGIEIRGAFIIGRELTDNEKELENSFKDRKRSEENN